MGIITSRDVDFLSNDCKHRSLGDVSDTIDVNREIFVIVI